MTTVTVLSPSLRLQKPVTSTIKSLKDVDGKGVVVFTSFPDFEFPMSSDLTVKTSGLKTGQAVKLAMAEGSEQQFTITPVPENEAAPKATRPTGNGAAHPMSMSNELM